MPAKTATEIETRVDHLLERMTLAEKVGQMTQVEKNSISPQAVAAHGIGSVLSGGGGNPTPNTPTDWAQMVRSFQEAALQSRLGIPILYGVDAVHGHNNVYGATIFPHNIGLGATRDADLVRRVAQTTARELRATHVNWDFAPSVSVPQDIRWGRTYEGFSEDTALTTELSAAFVRGLQGDDLSQPEGVLASVKHFIGDGGTTWGSTAQYDWIPGWWKSPDPQRWKIDQGDTRLDEAQLRSLHLPPYKAAIAAGARNIMVSYSSWNGMKLHAHHYLLTEMLKGELGFDGFLVSDWLGVNQLDADFCKAVSSTINAGLDMVMVPFEYELFIDCAIRAVENRDIKHSRIDDAVRRILRVKFAMGLFEHPYGDEALLPDVGCNRHRQIAREAVSKSLVLLKNESNVLPLSRSIPRILVAGEAADNIGLQCGGWTIEWQGGSGQITPGTTLLEALHDTVSASCSIHYFADGASALSEQADVGIVVLSESPYTEGEGDRYDLSLSQDDIALVQRVRQHCSKVIVILYSGRPLIINEVLESCDGFVAAWLPGTEGQGIADVLFGKQPFTGRLPHHWPRDMAQVPFEAAGDRPLFPLGFGL